MIKFAIFLLISTNRPGVQLRNKQNHCRLNQIISYLLYVYIWYNKKSKTNFASKFAEPAKKHHVRKLRANLTRLILHLGSKLNSKTAPVLPSFHPSLIFIFHLLPSLVHPIGFCFCFFSGFLAIFILLSSNNNNNANCARILSQNCTFLLH